MRVDIESALNAALDRQHFDVVVFDPSTPHISRGLVDACLRAHRRSPCVIVFESIADAVERIKEEVDQLQN